MADPARLSIYNIAAHGGFADALAQGLLDRFGKDRMALARGLILLPNNRAVRAVQDAFVRLSENGLLLPQMAVIGDLELDESIGVALEQGALTLEIPPAIHPMDRLLQLAKLIQAERDERKDPILARDAVRLAREFARTLDQLTVEEINPSDLLELDVEPALSGHWQEALDLFREIVGQWQKYLQSSEMVDEATRRNLLFSHIARNWRDTDPQRLIVAAGITTAAPAIARLQKVIAGLSRGMVVVPDVDLQMSDEEWSLLGPFENEADGVRKGRAQETHPQYHLKLLLERMSVSRGEILRWPRIGPSGAVAQRSKALGHAFAIPEQTGRWMELEAKDRRLANVQTVEARTSAEEAQMVALLVREALETPGKRVAVITPNRGLAQRISSHLERWQIQADDTAGLPLSKTPQGVFFISLIATLTQGFAPAELLSVLKHPLAKGTMERGEWLRQVRRFDLLMRGPRQAPGLAAIETVVQHHLSRHSEPGFADWWDGLQGILADASERLGSATKLSEILDIFRVTASWLSADQLWRGNAGRTLADFLTDLDSRSALAPERMELKEMSAYFADFLDNISIRPTYGGHPRIAIYGLLEARLQQADLTICCGLNEGTWPQSISPDPWLAPMIRKTLGLSAQERQIGLSAHDLVGAMGAREVVLTRALRDDAGPAIASRFLLRLQAMCGDGLQSHEVVQRWARSMDRPERPLRISPPAPKPTADQRNVNLSVTDIDRLIADPFGFYAAKIMRLRALDQIDAEPSAAWRGSAIHGILEAWAKEDDYAADKLVERAQNFLAERSSHPLMRSLWAPRLMRGLSWIAERVAKQRVEGREPLKSEYRGTARIVGVQLSGIADRIDRMPDGSLAIIDYKTGLPPSNSAINAGFRLQLGLLGAIAERQGFEGVDGTVSTFEYWSLSKKGGSDKFGYVTSPATARGSDRIDPDDMVAHAIGHFSQAIERYILGDAPMEAKLHPEFAPYADYDQLMRLEEWYGRLNTSTNEAADG